MKADLFCQNCGEGVSTGVDECRHSPVFMGDLYEWCQLCGSVRAVPASPSGVPEPTPPGEWIHPTRSLVHRDIVSNSWLVDGVRVPTELIEHLRNDYQLFREIVDACERNLFHTEKSVARDMKALVVMQQARDRQRASLVKALAEEEDRRIVERDWDKK